MSASSRSLSPVLPWEHIVSGVGARVLRWKRLLHDTWSLTPANRDHGHWRAIADAACDESGNATDCRLAGGCLNTTAEVAKMIQSGACLMVAGDERLLAELPEGNWIGGTIPYFMTESGGCRDVDHVFVTELPSEVRDVEIRRLTKHDLGTIYGHATRDQVSLLILPYGSDVHTEFALNAPYYPGFAAHPVLGWVSGIDLEPGATGRPACFAGNGEGLYECGVELKFRLPPDLRARIDAINLFEQGDGDGFRFPVGGLSVRDVLVNGVSRNFAEYLAETGCDPRLPLVAEYCNTMVNAGIRKIDLLAGVVEFYGPVWEGIEYRQALPLDDYVKAFSKRLDEIPDGRIVFSCNCILNYLYSGLEGKKTGRLTGPMTFGEIAYQLMNQTLVCLTFEKRKIPEGGARCE